MGSQQNENMVTTAVSKALLEGMETKRKNEGYAVSKT
jgi:hypothetical protein